MTEEQGRLVDSNGRLAPDIGAPTSGPREIEPVTSTGFTPVEHMIPEPPVSTDAAPIAAEPDQVAEPRPAVIAEQPVPAADAPPVADAVALDGEGVQALTAADIPALEGRDVESSWSGGSEDAETSEPEEPVAAVSEPEPSEVAETAAAPADEAVEAEGAHDEPSETEAVVAEEAPTQDDADAGEVAAVAEGAAVAEPAAETVEADEAATAEPAAEATASDEVAAEPAAAEPVAATESESAAVTDTTAATAADTAAATAAEPAAVAEGIRRVTPTWPFVVYLVLWAGLCILAGWQLLQIPIGEAISVTEMYRLTVIGGVVMTVVGPLLILAVWLASWFRAGEGPKAGLFPSALLKGSVVTLLGVAMWWGTLLIVDQARLGRFM